MVSSFHSFAVEEHCTQDQSDGNRRVAPKLSRFKVSYLATSQKLLSLTPSLINSRSVAAILEKFRTNILDALAMAKKDRTSSFDDGCVASFKASTLLLSGRIPSLSLGIQKTLFLAD